MKIDRSDWPVYQCRYCKRGGHVMFEITTNEVCPLHGYPQKCEGTLAEVTEKFFKKKGGE